MNSELFSFSILAAILGMAVVFVFLGILSFLMFAIKTVFGEKPAREGGSAARLQQQSTEAEQAEGDAGWVIAAAAAYLIEEEGDARRSAAPWKPAAERSADAWLRLPRV